jgi:hypothetical protein
MNAMSEQNADNQHSPTTNINPFDTPPPGPDDLVQNESYNPFFNGDPEKLAELVALLLPKAPALSPEEQVRYDEGERSYAEKRYGPLPPDMYRILRQGSVFGWTYELEIDGKEVLLYHPEPRGTSFALYGNPALAETQARAEIARRHGEEASTRARFIFVWGGKL